MAGNRKINNEEQLASVRAKLNDNFDDLSNVTTQLQPLTAVTGGGSDGFMRANADGTFDTIKTVPPDGGLGAHPVLQSMSNFAGKLPDAIIADVPGPLVYRLRYLNEDVIQYTENQNGGFFIFDNDSVGTRNGGTSTYEPYEGATASLQDIIDGGHAVYHGQKSGTSGSGSLNLIKTLVNKSANGGFYTELPDVIYPHVTTTDLDYYGVFYLDLVKPNSSAGTGSSANWEVIYRPSNSTMSLRFNLDHDGTLQLSSGFSNLPTSTGTNNLRWYIENGAAAYLGGQQDFGIKAWGKFDGTGSTGQLTFTGGNVSSVEKIDTGTYKVTFTNAMPHADYAVSGTANPSGYNGAAFGHRDYNPTGQITTAQSFYIDVRTHDNTFTDTNRVSFQVVC